jgi:beta-glucanase (GH16 family)
MIDLLKNKADWVNEFPWGTSIDPFITNSMSEMVIWKPDGTVEFNVSDNFMYKGWVMDDNWQRKDCYTPYVNGMIISKQQFLYGTFHWKMRLPGFRGSWPGGWLIDVTNNMGCPPEVDAFEGGFKDCLLSWFHLTATYNDGPTYENNLNISKVKRYWLPITWFDIDVDFVWRTDYLSIIIDGKLVMEIHKSDYHKFPNQPMNFIFGSGIGNWNPQKNKFKPVILKSLTYESL